MMAVKSMKKTWLRHVKAFFPSRVVPSFLATACILVSACSSGGGGGTGGAGTGSDSADFGCDGGCANLSLTEADVRQITAQAVAAIEALGSAGTVAVVDRVGNVLSVYRMDGAPGTAQINGQIGANGGLEGLQVPATLAAISKAGTAAFLSSQGNAFSTRTASQIVQEHFNPGERNAPGGPLFGVQFSQLICSDVTVLNPSFKGGLSSGRKALSSGQTGPRPLPLGLSADPGGLPLYRNGDMVGGVGVEFDGLYTLDRDIRDNDDLPEERAALTATIGFETPSERVAERITVAGRALRFSDLDYSSLDPLPESLPELKAEGFVSVPLFTDGAVRPGAAFGDIGSGVLKSVRAGVASAILVDAGGGNRFPTRAGTAPTDGNQLTPAEVDALLDSALVTASRARAAIRRPLDTGARVSIWVVDTAGVPLGFTRSQDAPIFGIDVALQKARTAAFFSSFDAAAKLSQAQATNGFGAFDDYAGRARAVIGADGLSNGKAITARAVGNLARPFFADGIDGNAPGPFSLSFPGAGPGHSWSPFNTGMQLDLVFQRLAQPLGLPGPSGSLPDSCTDSSVLGSRLRNGIQIFPGSVPLYRGTTLIGALGVSGDGIDQDDMVAFYGASRQGLDTAGHTALGDGEYGFNAPKEIRSDTIPLSVDGLTLRYVSCPEAPFSGDNDQNVCEGF